MVSKSESEAPEKVEIESEERDCFADCVGEEREREEIRRFF